MELKTHHEAWTGDKSVKRRFKLRNSELTGVRLLFVLGVCFFYCPAVLVLVHSYM